MAKFRTDGPVTQESYVNNNFHCSKQSIVKIWTHSIDGHNVALINGMSHCIDITRHPGVQDGISKPTKNLKSKLSKQCFLLWEGG